MRKQRQKQMNLAPEWLAFDHSRELQAIAGLLEANPTAAVLVWQDLVAAGLASDIQQRGPDGLSGDQVLRALIIKQLNSYSYRELAFHLADSQTYRRFCELGWLQTASKSALALCIKAVRADTLEKVNQVFVQAAARLKIEDGKKMRADTTVVESNIHAPLDSNLLWDSVRVLTRLMAEAQEMLGADVHFGNRTRRAKRRALGILNARNMEKREPLYRDLLKVAKETIDSADEVTRVIERATQEVAMELLTKIKLGAIGKQITHYIPLARQVVEQTQRRVLQGESVPAGEKLVSIFEEHTDIIVKDRRDTLYGHKICLTTGRSTLVTDCVILDGNPADATLAEQVIDRHIAILGKAPNQAAFDGGFTSKANLEALKAKGVSDVSFSKARSLSVTDMVRSSWVYKKLRNFRAGIEATISFLKRCFGMDRCTWRSLPSFKSYVWSSIVTFNLLVLARHLLA
jgi:IS5 family transposase